MKTKSNLIIEEENLTKQVKEELVELEDKWFKTSVVYREIELLKKYLVLKEKFMKELNKFHEDLFNSSK